MAEDLGNGYLCWMLRESRRRLDHTIDEAAHAIGVTPETWRHWEAAGDGPVNEKNVGEMAAYVVRAFRPVTVQSYVMPRDKRDPDA